MGLESLILNLYTAGFNIWNTLVEFSVGLFKTDPMTANGSVSYTIYSLWSALRCFSVPIAVIFFLIAIIKDTVSAPPEQSATRLLLDTTKCAALAIVINNLWTIMQGVCSVTDLITQKIANGSVIGNSYKLYISNTCIKDNIETVLEQAKPDDGFITDIITNGLGQTLMSWLYYIGVNLLFLIAALVTLVIIVAAGISIVNAAFQRIIKPLAIIPFSSITVAMGAGTPEASRVTSQYFRSLFGLLLSGSFMIIAVKIGVTLISTNDILANISSTSPMQLALIYSIKVAVLPLIIAGLVKGADSILGRFF